MTSLACFWKIRVFNITIKRHYIAAINDLDLPPLKKNKNKNKYKLDNNSELLTILSSFMDAYADKGK